MNLGLRKEIPALWVSPSVARTLLGWLKRDNLTANINLVSDHGRGTTENIWVELPGKTEEYYVVCSHHDSYAHGAVQDASGVSIVLALAKHFAGQRERRPLRRKVIFLATGAHTLGRLGESLYVRTHRDSLMSKAALVVSVEHIGKALAPQPDLSFKVSQLPAPRLFLTSRNEEITRIVRSAIEENDYTRSLIQTQFVIKETVGKAAGVSGEFYEAGLPVIALASAPPYLFFPEDTPDVVAKDQLVPTVRVIRSILRAADQLPIESLRKEW